MGGSSQISIDYEDTIRKAKELEQIAESCKQIAGSADRILALLDENWKGDSGTAAHNLTTNWKMRENNLAEKMRTVAQQIIMVANSIKDADEAAAARNKG